MPIISPVSYHNNAGESKPLLLNVNGDTAAGEIACAMGTSRLIYLTDVAGLRGADGIVITHLSPAGVRDLLSSGVASGGMIPKLKSCLAAAEDGITCHIVDGRRPRALTETISGLTTGTTVRPEE
jgi:acetylglutamate kinase